MTSISNPWDTRARTAIAPGHVVLRLALGEAPSDIAPAEHILRGQEDWSTTFGITAVDRILRHHSDFVRIARVHVPARHDQFDDIESATGLAQTFQVAVDPRCPIGALVDALRCVGVVEAATPRYLTSLPLAAPALAADNVSMEDDLEGWQDRDLISGPLALAYEAGDPAVLVAVIDTGVTSSHESFAGSLRAGLDTVRLTKLDLSPGMELVGSSSGIDADTTDNVGHGTETAAIIGARAGILPPGLASGCGLLPMRALGAARVGNRPKVVGVGSLVDIDVAIKYAVDLGAKVINLSLGTPVHDLDCGKQLPHSEAIRYAIARNCIVVAAAGNSGQDEDFVPACLDGVIAVGALDRTGRPAGFSTRSDHVAVSAPGERILTAAMDGGYARVTGTSFATPFVSGAAALLASRANRRAEPIDGPTVRRLLMQTATPWPDPPPHGSGVGTLDALAALKALDAEIDARWPMNAP